ncbi:MAG: hypothetical protein WA628_27450, partial [Terriglobales bacterium]
RKSVVRLDGEFCTKLKEEKKKEAALFPNWKGLCGDAQLFSPDFGIPLDSLKSQQYKLLLSCLPGLCPCPIFWRTLTDAGL